MIKSFGPGTNIRGQSKVRTNDNQENRGDTLLNGSMQEQEGNLACEDVVQAC